MNDDDIGLYLAIAGVVGIIILVGAKNSASASTAGNASTPALPSSSPSGSGSSGATLNLMTNTDMGGSNFGANTTTWDDTTEW